MCCGYMRTCLPRRAPRWYHVSVSPVVPCSIECFRHRAAGLPKGKAGMPSPMKLSKRARGQTTPCALRCTGAQRGRSALQRPPLSDPGAPAHRDPAPCQDTRLVRGFAATRPLSIGSCRCPALRSASPPAPSKSESGVAIVGPAPARLLASAPVPPASGGALSNTAASWTALRRHSVARPARRPSPPSHGPSASALCRAQDWWNRPLTPGILTSSLHAPALLVSTPTGRRRLVVPEAHSRRWTRSNSSSSA
mmetsp:Transcript_34333/g.94870  ORF Transcript_34333/g.94870 Transcript_34333/m.94870 type:complete len:251 (+) Transcript_34333:73-825(+)